MSIRVEKPTFRLQMCHLAYVEPDVCGGPAWAIVVPVGSANTTTSIVLCLNHCAQLKERLPIGTEAKKADSGY